MKVSQEVAIASSIVTTAALSTSVYSASKFFKGSPRISLIAWGALGMIGVGTTVASYSALKHCNLKTTLNQYSLAVVNEGIDLISKAGSVLPSDLQPSFASSLEKAKEKAKECLDKTSK